MRGGHRGGVLLLVAVVLASGLSGAWGLERARASSAEAAANRELAAVQSTVAADVQAVVDETGRLGRRVSAIGRFVPSLVTTSSSHGASVTFVTPTPGGLVVSGDAVVDAATLDRIRGTLDVARDTATTKLTTALPLVGGGYRTFAVAPSYLIGGDSLPISIATTDLRRERLLGFVMVGVDAESIAADAQRDAVAVAVAVGSATLGAVGPQRSRVQAASGTVAVAGQIVAVSVEEPRGAPVGGATTALLAAMLALTAAIVVTTRIRARRASQAVKLADDRARQLELLTTIAPIVQETMDLSVILPAVSTRLHDAFGLAGIGFALPNAAGVVTDVFALGSIGQPAMLPDFPHELGANEAVAIPLHRGARSAGVLRVRTSRPLTATEIDALRATAELVTAAIVHSQLFEQQEEAIRALREVDELKTVFLSTASHELRTPVTAISGFSSLLADRWDEFDEEQRRLFASRIAANAGALESSVKELLDFAGLERGRLAVAVEPVDLAAATKCLLQRLESLFATHPLATDLEATGHVRADPAGLERILSNIVTNAVKYSPEGARITVSTARALGGATLTVDDEGPGVPERERSRIFSRFFRGSGQAVIRVRGTGIGLSVVKELVNQMGGEISVGTAPGGGARFRVWFAAATKEDVE